MAEITKHTPAIIGSTIFVIIVFLILFLCGFTVKLPLPEEEVLILDFMGGGNKDAGLSSGGDNNNDNSEYIPDNGYLVQNTEESIYLPESKNPNENQSTEVTPTQPEPPKNKANERLGKNFGGSLQGGNGSGSGGTGTGGGNPGSGISGSGGGSGNAPDGSGNSLTGRRQINKVSPPNVNNLFGEVKFQITVSPSGKVESATLVSSNCSECVELAKEAVLKWTYEAIDNKNVQTGYATIKFKPKN